MRKLSDNVTRDRTAKQPTSLLRRTLSESVKFSAGHVLVGIEILFERVEDLRQILA